MLFDNAVESERNNIIRVFDYLSYEYPRVRTHHVHRTESSDRK